MRADSWWYWKSLRKWRWGSFQGRSIRQQAVHHVYIIVGLCVYHSLLDSSWGLTTALMFSMFKGVVHFELMSWQDECRIMICFWRGWIERVIQWLKKQSHLLGRDKELEVGECVFLAENVANRGSVRWWHREERGGVKWDDGLIEGWAVG